MACELSYSSRERTCGEWLILFDCILDRPVIISNSKKYIFVHLHKTAGTAITNELVETAEWNDIVLQGRHGSVNANWYADRYKLEMHSGADAIKSVVGERVWDGYYTFTFVRDPYRRILSLYTWIEGLVKTKSRMGSFERYIRPNSGIWPWPGTKAYLATQDFSEFLRHPFLEGQAPGAAKMTDSLYEGDLLLVDFVGKQESLDTDINVIRNRIGLVGDIVKPNNVSNSQIDPNDYYKTQADLDLVYERYKVDFEAFGYARCRVGEL